MEPLAELIHLLSGRDLEEEAVDLMVAAVRDARNDPDLDWMDEEAEQEEWTQIAIEFQLVNFIQTSDKVDELHELISNEFEVPLRDFPQHADKMDFLPDDYFRWLDEELAGRNPEAGGYELILWGNQLDDNLHALVVFRRDTPRILELAEQLALRVERATQRQYC